MGFSKAHLYPDLLNCISNCGKTIAHPARLSIIMTLWSYGPMTVQQLKKKSPLARQTFSQHLKTLRDHRFVSYHEEYPYIIYSLNQEVVKKSLSNVVEFYSEMFDD